MFPDVFLPASILGRALIADAAVVGGESRSGSRCGGSMAKLRLGE